MALTSSVPPASPPLGSSDAGWLADAAAVAAAMASAALLMRSKLLLSAPSEPAASLLGNSCAAVPKAGRFSCAIALARAAATVLTAGCAA